MRACLIIIGLSAVLVFSGVGSQSAHLVSAIFAQQQSAEKPWTGRTANGAIITKEELARILVKHKRWLQTQKREGERADLSGADLREADLREADLSESDISGTNLMKANLSGANLHEANLLRANLREADLSEAADLDMANLIEANLRMVNLRGARMIAVKLERTNLSEANMQGALMQRAKLMKANLRDAHLNEADLLDADLSEANLRGADLSASKLISNLSKADLSGALFEPDPDHLPLSSQDVDKIASARGLAELWYIKSPQSLVKLRKSFKEAGYRQQEREISCSLKRSDSFQSWQEGGVGRIKAVFNYVFFDLTCKYGISPWRPLTILSFCLLIFFPFYCLALKSRRTDTGIWLVWLPDRVLKGEGQGKPIKLTVVPPFRRPATSKWAMVWWYLKRGFRIIRLGIYFSLVSAFSLGWKELNVGNWITRIQTKEYTLKPTGWVRTLAGIQSLISAFLLALWAFLYIGSIFE